MLDQTRYQDHAALAEERAFLKDYTIPFVQLDPLKTILVFSHSHNTFDKKRLLENPHPDYLKVSPKTVDMFIKNENEKHIKQFFTKDMESLLEKYEPGQPKMKPEVLAQTKQIEEERKKMMERANTQQFLNNTFNKNNQNIQSSNNIPQLPPGSENNITIMMQEEGKEPVPMNMQQIVQLLQTQQNENNRLKTETDTLKRRVVEMEDIIRQLQQLKVNSTNSPQYGGGTSFSLNNNSFPGSAVANSAPYLTNATRLKSDPEVNIRA
jgi:hypothetical protein